MSGTGLIHDIAGPVDTALTGMARLRREDRRRRTIILVILGALLVALALLSLTLGASDLTPADVLAVFTGGGETGQQFIVFKLRLPRLLTAILVGIAFALAGGLFQTTLRNTLASPDILGISGGASVAAVFALLVLGLTGPAVSLIAFAGAALVAVIIGALSWRQSLSGYRFVLIGIAIAFLVSGVLGYLLTRADERSASSALLWLVGSIGDPSWPEIILLAICLAALAPVIIALGPRLRMLGLGDDTARALGTPPTATAIVALAVAVALAAAATATAGPVAFVAFVSAPIARRMMRGPGLELVAASLVGAVIVTGADLIAQHLIPANFNAPVGLVTGLIGAPYLLWLLATADRKERS